MTRTAILNPAVFVGQIGGAGLRARALRSSAWTVGGFAFTQCFRIASNLALTYLLFPRAFGLMALVRIFLDGLQMFSDVGIGPSIIQKARGDDPAYVNTAWTIQVIRGMWLWLVACLIAWPASQVWDPELLLLLPVAGATAALAGFNATSLFMLNRSLDLRAVTTLQVCTQVFSVAVMVVWAMVHPSAWALLGGRIAGDALTLIVSHRLNCGPRNRFTWDAAAARELFSFGRWVFLSTVITFLAMQSDKLLLGKLLSTERLGVFWLAMSIAQVGPLLMRKLASTVGFPVLAELHRTDVERFRRRLHHVRLGLILPVNVGLLFIAALGQWLITRLYPPSFHDAGWMLAVLACGSLAGMVNSSYGNAFLAVGSTASITVGVAGQLLIMLAATLTGYALAGEAGFILGIACVQWLLYPLYALLAARVSVWQPKLDLPVLAAFGAAAALVLL